MGFFANTRMLMRVLRRAKRPMEKMALLRKCPSIMLGVNLFEVAGLASNKLDGRLKGLAGIKTAALIGCPF